MRIICSLLMLPSFPLQSPSLAFIWNSMHCSVSKTKQLDVLLTLKFNLNIWKVPILFKASEFLRVYKITEEKMEEKFGFRTMAAPPPLRPEEDKEKVGKVVILILLIQFSLFSTFGDYYPHFGERQILVLCECGSWFFFSIIKIIFIFTIVQTIF